MGDNSSIEWTDATWNPVRGCSIVSKGCTNCYAMRQAHRSNHSGGAYQGLTKLTKGGPVWTGAIRAVPELLDQPRSWKRPRRIFVNSMSDLFHEDVPDDFIGDVWRAMADSQQHIFQILTKRPGRMLQWLCDHGGDAVFAGEEDEYKASLEAHGWPLRNVWLGVSVEDQSSADERLPLLLQTPAAVRWISAEPLLGRVDLTQIRHQIAASSFETFNALYEKDPLNKGHWRPKLSWVVAGGESGPGARPMHPAWARSLRDQCSGWGVPFFFKQWGNWVQCETEVIPEPGPVGGRKVYPLDDALLEKMGERGYQVVEAHGAEFLNLGKKIAGRELDGRTHDAYPK